MAAIAAVMLPPVLSPGASASADTLAAAATSQFEADVEDFVAKTARAEAMEPRQLQALRARFGFRRGTTGKVQIRSKAGEWYDIRLDMQLPGICMVRSPKGDVFVLQLQQVQQIDLSNDLIVVSLFGDGGWEDSLQPLELGEGSQQLNMGAQEFRESLGVLSDLLEVVAVEQQQQQKGKR